MLPNPTLRRLLWAEAGVAGTANTLMVVLTVFAFEVGGSSLLSVALGARFLGVGMLRPVVGVAIDKLPARQGLRIGAAVGSAGTLACLAGGLVGGVVGVIPVIVGTCLVKLGHSIAKSGRRAVITVASETPEQATATISLLSLVGTALALAGPLVASVALVRLGVAAAMLIAVIPFLVASAVMWGLVVPGAAPSVSGPVRQVLSGQRETLRAPVVARSFVLLGTAAFLNGATAVFYAPLAVDALGSGEGGVGILRTGFGLGGLVASAALVRRRVGGGGRNRFTVGVAVWGVVLVALPHTGILGLAMVPMVAMGVGRTMVDTGYLTVLQRALPGSLHPRVLGLGETVNVLAGGLGALLAAPLLSVLGLASSMALIGVVGVVVAGVVGAGLGRDVGDDEEPAELHDLLSSTPTLALLPPIELDLLVLRMRERRLEPGEHLIVEGDVGESWFVIDAGSLEVRSAGCVVADVGPGDGVGEIALLRRCARTATVTATSEVVAFELDRTMFLRAVGLADRSDLDELVSHRLSGAASSAGEGGPTGAR